ncbi:uncharacterized protein M437DRAFT_89321 [Aureobasidium melanogenum CBS 110374]|uniref:Uncharacterized protein n=1 Tax=Aureobasidium melanogenum (strain CBS 110374) TaxID=1043003 RepID=A0A074VJ14_AURM1|nr:uncharacterized protein M437DRAFT_89321 [Aureobasidium melanogenum CBS 110374]KEQ57577.1 hypothetical protein M437DRAFT_89321 [Aureobasidium melanogenum CBS 110374]
MNVSSISTSSSPNRIDSCLTKEEVQHALDVFCETDCEDLYKSENYKFAFLVLKSNGNVAKRIVEKWLDHDGNISTAYLSIDLEPPSDLSKALYDWAVIKIPETPDTLSFIKKGLTGMAQPMVFIPLQDWNSENGCPWKDDEVKAGEGVVISGSESIQFPGSGFCILIVIRLQPSGPGHAITL